MSSLISRIADFLLKRFLSKTCLNTLYFVFSAPKPVGRRARKPGIDRKPRQAYSAKQLDRLENEFKVIMVINKF